MESSRSLSKGHPPAGESQQRTWAKFVRTACTDVLKGACTAVGAGAVSLLVWWIENR
ncbi:hypothetical protein ACIQU5_26615 [Streptomyces sp. NPDC090306]|uniref:hypothetical protein n=1 Tax=Streptomyces sp. NPDC090306 TaxID=3365961 RepID=UPI003815A77E